MLNCFPTLELVFETGSYGSAGEGEVHVEESSVQS